LSFSGISTSKMLFGIFPFTSVTRSQTLSISNLRNYRRGFAPFCFMKRKGEKLIYAAFLRAPSIDRFTITCNMRPLLITAICTFLHDPQSTTPAHSCPAPAQVPYPSADQPRAPLAEANCRADWQSVRYFCIHAQKSFNRSKLTV
jgi:hypothetical protein